MKKPEVNTSKINKQRKWEKEISSILHDNDELLKQFNKDSELKDTEELSYKLYIYKKNGLNLFHKILSQRYLELLEDNKLKSMGKITIKLDDEIEEFIKQEELDLTATNEININESGRQIFPGHHHITKWNMLQNYKYQKPEEPEFDIYSTQKLIEQDPFLKFALDAIAQTKDYEDAVKDVYTKYIKEDKYLSKQLKVYESYYMYINEEANTEYQNIIERILAEYEMELTSEKRMDKLIYSNLSKLIDINTEFVKENLKNYSDKTKSILYTFFNSNFSIILSKFEKLNIDYNELFERDDNALVERIIGVMEFDEMSARFIIDTLTSLEITNFLYIDSEETITIVFFTCLAIIFKQALGISI